MPHIETGQQFANDGLDVFAVKCTLKHDNHLTIVPVSSKKLRAPRDLFRNSLGWGVPPCADGTGCLAGPTSTPVRTSRDFQDTQQPITVLEGSIDAEHDLIPRQGNGNRNCGRVDECTVSRLLSKKKIRRNPNVVMVGRVGRGVLRCLDCRNCKSKCVSPAINVPCGRCVARGVVVCIKVWGRKNLNETLNRLPVAILSLQLPTAANSVIDPQDVSLLQFGYSNDFLRMAGNLIGILLRKFGAIFTPSINSASLRHAVLALAAAFSSAPSAYMWMEDHSESAQRVLRHQNSETIEDVDIYASLLLCVLSCLYNKSEQFTKRLEDLVTMMAMLKRKEWKKGNSGHLSNNHLSIFLPVGRDLILEMSRRVPNIKIDAPLIQFSYISHYLIGPATFHQRAQYEKEFYGFGSCQYSHHLFTNGLLHHYTILRRCFRQSLLLQIEESDISEAIHIVVSETKADLQSREFVHHLWVLVQTMGDFNTGLYEDSMQFFLVLHNFCQLIILLLEEKTLKQGVASPNAIFSASSLLQLIKYRWLGPGTCNFLVNQAGDVKMSLVRMLCVAGMILNPEYHPEPSKFILYGIGRTGETEHARFLQNFWDNSDWRNLGQLWDLPSNAAPSPFEFYW